MSPGSVIIQHIFTEKCFRSPKTLNRTPFPSLGHVHGTADATAFRRTLNQRHAALGLYLGPLISFLAMTHHDQR